jgi:hypothetical protein
MPAPLLPRCHTAPLRRLCCPLFQPAPPPPPPAPPDDDDFLISFLRYFRRRLFHGWLFDT